MLESEILKKIGMILNIIPIFFYFSIFSLKNVTPLTLFRV